MEQLGRLRMAGVPVKRPGQLADVDALIIPGGESTAISRLIGQNGLYETLRAFSRRNPVMGVCAGAILCCSAISRPDQEVVPQGLLDAVVSRNGFGRQGDSFETPLRVKGVGEDFPAVFIRAPYIERVGKDVAVLAEVDGKIVMAECGNILAVSFTRRSPATRGYWSISAPR